MGLYCKGICVDFKGSSMPNFLRYKSGQKGCTACSMLLEIDEVRCPCCGVVFRTRARNRKKQNSIVE